MGEFGEIGTLVLIGRRCDENLLELYGGEVMETALLIRKRCAPFGDEFLGCLGLNRGVHSGTHGMCGQPYQFYSGRNVT